MNNTKYGDDFRWGSLCAHCAGQAVGFQGEPIRLNPFAEIDISKLIVIALISSRVKMHQEDVLNSMMKRKFGTVKLAKKYV
ncbi:MAG: hypothetical protein ABIK28_12400 [Planctomycetota bacterium]